jgi:hypothetical protein
MKTMQKPIYFNTRRLSLLFGLSLSLLACAPLEGEERPQSIARQIDTEVSLPSSKDKAESPELNANDFDPAIAKTLKEVLPFIKGISTGEYLHHLEKYSYEIEVKNQNQKLSLEFRSENVNFTTPLSLYDAGPYHYGFLVDFTSEEITKAVWWSDEDPLEDIHVLFRVVMAPHQDGKTWSPYYMVPYFYGCSEAAQACQFLTTKADSSIGPVILPLSY